MPILTKSPAPGDFPKRISIHPGQRINANSLPKKVVQPARMLVDWVIQPEVPLKSGKPDGTYLQFSTRRAFMEDDVQVRIQLENVQLPDTAVVSIVLTDQDGTLDPDDEFAVFTNDTSKFKASSFEVGVFDRPLQRSNDVEAEPFSVTSTRIAFQVDAAKDATFLCTTINLPADPSNTEPDDLEYFVVVFIQAFGKTFRGSSPRLDAHRWWANPGRNLGFRKTDSAITTLIDGDNYFAAVVAAMNAATTRICIASWTLDLTTTIAGVPLFTTLLAAASRGVQVLFLLDFHNGTFNVGNVRGLGSPNIKVRISSHPFVLPQLGQFGSYHEKYVCVDSTLAFPGGIDFFPDRRAPVDHATTQNPGDDIPFWHDVGVRVQGVIAQDIERDFIRRWNEGDDFDTSTGQLKRPPPVADNLPPPPVAARTARNHKAQVVKTDTTIVTSTGAVGAPLPSAASLDHLGTLDAFLQAIKHARHFIYMENQYYRDQDLADAMVDALNKNTSLQVILIVPFSSEEELALAGVKEVAAYSTWQARQAGTKGQQEAFKRATLHGMKLQFDFIDKLRKANGAATRVGIYALATCLSGTATMIYPHAKTAVIDDTWAYIGSANMNGRGLQATDAEMGVLIHDRSLVTAYRKALFKEHLNLDLETHELREFHRKWQSTAVRGKKKISDVTCADVASVQAVDFLDPPKGQTYNGPFELLFRDKFV
jgi:phosphatidylserine/phosphatidylglycerophosphate/cardiolipin synthase-like enzyme